MKHPNQKFVRQSNARVKTVRRKPTFTNISVQIGWTEKPNGQSHSDFPSRTFLACSSINCAKKIHGSFLNSCKNWGTSSNGSACQKVLLLSHSRKFPWGRLDQQTCLDIIFLCAYVCVFQDKICKYFGLMRASWNSIVTDCKTSFRINDPARLQCAFAWHKKW